PEVRFAPVRIDELRDLSVRRLVRRESRKARKCTAPEHRIAGERHADGTHRRIPPEDRRIAALARTRTRRGGQNATRGEVAREKLNRAAAALGQQTALVCSPGVRQFLMRTFTLRPRATAARLIVESVTDGSSRLSRRCTTARLVRMRRASSDWDIFCFFMARWSSEASSRLMANAVSSSRGLPFLDSSLVPRSA